jgi:hypothetical protein
MAILVAMVYGFNATLVVGATVYAAGFLAARWPAEERVVAVGEPVLSE